MLRLLVPHSPIRSFPVGFGVIIVMCLLVFAPMAYSHGGHAPGLTGDPSTPPPGAKITRDGAGRLVFVEFDSDGDGRSDIWNKYEKGELVRQEMDESGDGRPDIILDVKDGQVIKGQRDLNDDGKFEIEEYYKQGRLERQYEDTTGDGAFDTLRIAQGEFHARTETDTNADGKIDRWAFFELKEDGRIRLILEDLDFDGLPDRKTVFTTGEPPQVAPIDATGEEKTIEEPLDIDTVAKEEDADFVADEVLVSEERSLTAASDQEVRNKDFVNLPRSNPSDLVRLIPGVHVSQHTGGAKAYQYFLRGFDAEHGRDLAAYMDGIPLNEPSQVHGHGYLDLHFLIPETLETIKIVKGPYDPEYGNFATAGAINFIPRRLAPDNRITTTAGMFGTAKVAGAFGMTADPYLFVGALEADHSEGYTDPGDTDAVRANTGHTLLLGPWSLNLMSNHYGQNSAATDVIPEQYVKDGLVDRYGTLDDSDRVLSNRHLIGLTADLDRGANTFRMQGFADYKRTTIWSNYTFYLLNPEKGDQQEMRDNRLAYGANLRYVNVTTAGSVGFETALGMQWRADDVDQVLANSAERERWNVTNDLDFTENAMGLWLREKLFLTKWLTVVPGARYDTIFYNGEGTQDQRYFNIYTNKADVRQDVQSDWDENASIFSPKASVIFTPVRKWDIFLNYGEGFFSNTTLQMADKPRSTIPKVRGAETGTRFFAWKDKITFAAAAWMADKEEDLVFDPQTGLSSTKDKTRRLGLDGEFRLSPIPSLYLSTDASYVDARFVESGDKIPNGPIFLMTNGLGWNHDSGFRGLLRGRYMGERELDQGDFADPFYVLDLVSGYDRDKWGVELAVDNVLDTEWEDAVFSYETRPEQNGETINGIHWTPGTPFFARFSVTAKF